MTVDRDKILQSAQKLVDKKRYDKAIAEYRKLVAKDPGDVRTLLKIGDLHLKLEQFEGAINTYEQVGEFYFREGFSVKAIAVYKQIKGIIRRHAAHLEGRYGHIIPRLAEIYTQLGLTSDALAAYDEVATRLRQDGRERDALDIFKKVVELDPQNPIAHLRVADSRARLGEIGKAVDGFGEAAKIMLRLGRHDDALKVLERLLEYRQEPEYARMAGEVYLQRNGPTDGMSALSKLQIAFKANPKDLETLATLAQAFEAINQPNKATEVLKESARVAKDKGDDDAFARIVDDLQQRAPDDPVIEQLVLVRDAHAEENRISSSETPQVMVELEPQPSLDESDVFELSDADLQTLNDVDDPQSAPARTLLEEAATQHANGHVTYAIQMLRDGLRSLGSQGMLRHKLSDLLLEAGDQAGAISEKLILAQELADVGNSDGATKMLDQVLRLQPKQPDALRRRANIKGAPRVNAPLQSYDVEAGGVDEALHRGAGQGAGSHPPDPPAAKASFEQAPPLAERISQPAPMETPQNRQLDESALEYAEGLAQQGRFDEARALLHQQLQFFPNNPLILDRLAEVDGAAAQAQPYPVAAPTAGQGTGPTAPYAAHQAHSAQQGYPGAPAGYGRPGPTAPPISKDSSVAPEMAELLEQVRAGVSKQVDDADATTHYDLGLAYMEMGLYSDALSELALAARDPYRECVCLSLAGEIQLKLGDTDGALDAMHRALNSPHKNRDQELKLGYEIAHAYELKHMPEQALHYFEWLTKLDPGYTDPRGSLTERIYRLRHASGAKRLPQGPPESVNAEQLIDDISRKNG